MRRLILVAMLAAAVPALAFAKTVKIPDDNTVAIVTIPDAWTINEMDQGVEATSPDSGVYLAVEVTASKDVGQSTADAIKWLEGRGVSIDAASMKQKDTTINGMEAVGLSFEGKDKDGPTRVSVMLIAASTDRLLLVTYWASPAGERANQAALRAIAASIKSVK